MLICGEIPARHHIDRQRLSWYVLNVAHLNRFAFNFHFAQNHTVERFWPEVNSRVNYPIKACLVDMVEQGDFDMDVEAHKFCVSWFTLRVANVGTSLVVRSWNEHRIPGIYECNCMQDTLL